MADNLAGLSTVPISVDDKDEVVVINFISDGLTALGKVWYTGQTVYVVKGSEAWESTLDADGNSFLELDEDGQLDRWGERFFKPGKWAGEGFDVTDEALTADEVARLKQIEAEQDGTVIEKPKRRGRNGSSAPVPRIG